MSDLLENFHFLRPWWLLAALPAAAAWWWLARASDPRQSFKGQIAPHLLDHLLVASKDRPVLRPVSLLLPLWLVAVFALAGPSWKREPAPFAEDQAGLMLVVKMTPSMETDDLQPSRLERVRHKVHELLQLRSGGKTSLIAYSGTAHVVMPFTEDASVIEHMLEALDPNVMPREGDALAEALTLASQRIEGNESPASILLIADAVQADQMTLLKQWRESQGLTVQILVPVADDAAMVESGVQDAANTLGVAVWKLSPDDRDVETINRSAESDVVSMAAETGARWRDDGYLLLPILLLGMAMWGRRGWSVTTE